MPVIALRSRWFISGERVLETRIAAACHFARLCLEAGGLMGGLLCHPTTPWKPTRQKRRAVHGER